LVFFADINLTDINLADINQTDSSPPAEAGLPAKSRLAATMQALRESKLNLL
jgi:hypothetical protein